MEQAAEPPQTTMCDLNDDVLRETFGHLNFKELDVMADVCSTFRRVARKEFASRHHEVFLFEPAMSDGIYTVEIVYPHWFSFLRKFGNATSSLHTYILRRHSPIAAISKYCSESLTELGLGSSRDLYSVTSEWQQLTPLLSRLRELRMHNIVFESGAEASRMLSLCVELRSLTYSHSSGDEIEFLDSPVALPKLKSLDLDGCAVRSIECLVSLNPQLEEIKLPCWCSRRTYEMVDQYVPNITELTVRHGGAIIDDWIFKNLKTLHIRFERLAPVLMLKAVADAAIPLEHLGLHGCYRRNDIQNNRDVLIYFGLQHCLNLKHLRELDLICPDEPLSIWYIGTILQKLPWIRKLRLKQYEYKLDRIEEIIKIGPNLQSLTYDPHYIRSLILDDDKFMSIRNAVVNHSEHRPFHLRLDYNRMLKLNVSQKLLEANSHILRVERLPEKICFGWECCYR